MNFVMCFVVFRLRAWWSLRIKDWNWNDRSPRNDEIVCWLIYEHDMSWYAWNYPLMGAKNGLTKSISDRQYETASTERRWGPSIAEPYICLTLGLQKLTTIRWFIDGPFCSFVIPNWNPIFRCTVNFSKCSTTEVEYGTSSHRRTILHGCRF